MPDFHSAFFFDFCVDLKKKLRPKLIVWNLSQRRFRTGAMI